MNGPAVVYGAGGHARVVAGILAANGIRVRGHFDDSYETGSTERIFGVPILGAFAEMEAARSEASVAYIAVGDNDRRCIAFEQVAKWGFELPALIHPTAIVDDSVTIGKASVICMGAIVGVEARIGRACIVNSGSSIDHECDVGDYCHVCPRVAIAGRVTVGDRTFIGIGSAVADRLTVGTDVTIGANSTVVRDVPAGTRVTGLWA